MSDEYPRVRNNTVVRTVWVEDPNQHRNTHKVVPADAIVIEQSEMSEVVDGVATTGKVGSGFNSWDTPESLRDDALRKLSLAEYLREPPPVPEPSQRDVDFLTGRLLDASLIPYTACAGVARRLLRTGRVHVDTEDATT